MKKFILSFTPLLLAAGAITLYVFDPFSKINKLTYLIIACVLLIFASVVITSIFFERRSKLIKRLQNRISQLNNTSMHVQNAGDLAVNSLPIGILVYDDDFNIKWANDNLKNIFQSKLVDESLNDISEELVLNIRAKTERYILKHEGMFLEVLSNNAYNVLYFFNQTDREKLNILYHNRISAIGIISIDHLEEAIKRYDMQEQSNIRGQILGEIADYARGYNAYLQSYNERLVLLFDHKTLDKMITDKFSVLNDIREVTSKYHLKTLVSIGIACYDTKYDELGSLAQQALELAQKRGGDQVVVNIENEKIQYFGGNANAIEKSNVNASVHSKAIREAIENATNVVVMAHRMADCDAFASTLSMMYLAKSCGKEVYGIYDEKNVDSSVKKLHKYLSEESPELIADLVGISDVDIKTNTLLIQVDTQSPAIAMYPDLLNKINHLVVIDHHRHGDVSFKDPIVNYVEPYASSTVELITEIFGFFGKKVEIPAPLATVALAGLVVDTNNFTYRTGSRTFEACSVLKEYEGDMAIVHNLLRDSFDIESLLASCVTSAEIIFNKFAVVRIPDERILDERSLLAKISDRLLNIDNIVASFTIGCIEHAGFIGISARSLDQINVQVIMEEMGGGGHLNAAAYQKEGTTVDTLYNQLIEILKREYDEDGGKSMKVILLEDVKGRGLKNQIIDVANGYGNYLITNNKALVANDENKKKLEEMEEKARQDEIEHKALMEKLKEEIETKPINLYIKLGEDGKLFGHITTKQICDEFEAQTGIKLDKRKVELQSEINSVGIYQARVNLHKDVIATIEIKVLEK